VRSAKIRKTKNGKKFLIQVIVKSERLDSQ